MPLTIAVIFLTSLSLSDSVYSAMPETKVEVSLSKIFYDSFQLQTGNYPEERRTSFEGKERFTDVRNNTVLFFILIFLLSIILFIVISSPEYTKDVFLSVFTFRYFLNVFHKKKYTLLINNVLLDITFLVVIFLFVFINSNTLFFEIVIEKAVLIIMASYAVILVALYIFYHIFFGNDFHNLHVRNTLIHNRISAIMITPLLFISFYLDSEFRFATLDIIAIILLLTFVWRTIRIFRLLKNTSNFNSIYILLYLCVFEISPYLIIYKEFGYFLSLKF